MTVKGYIVKTVRHREYVAVFKKGNVVVRCFKYLNTAKGWRPSLITDPLNWVEDCGAVSVPRGTAFGCFTGDPFLWDAMKLLESHIKKEGW